MVGVDKARVKKCVSSDDILHDAADPECRVVVDIFWIAAAGSGFSRCIFAMGGHLDYGDSFLAA
jgi:hypothetical protein